jgi:hypothetical protein
MFRSSRCKNKKECYDAFDDSHSQIKSYGPNLISINSGRGWEWFKMWFVVVFVVLVACCLISIVDTPLNKNNLMGYVNISRYTDRTSSARNSLKINTADYSKLSPERLRGIDIEFIPSLIDYDEMNFR